ncbi:MAG TPA: hypothetical protein DE179_06770 [Oceanospirillaceae bacterium]|nr:hypothetical protein [Oceanospirillaceae bacterium]
MLSAAVVSYWIYGQYGAVDMGDQVQVGQFLLTTMGVGMLSNIVMVIVMSIVASILFGKGEKPVFDERDKLIELYVMRAILVIFSLGFVITLGLVGWYSLSANMALLVLFLCMYGANIVGDLVKLYWYR